MPQSVSIADVLKCPEEPPGWLAQWPTERGIQSLFTEGMRRYSARMLRQDRPDFLTWDSSTLSLQIGSQKAVWRLVGRQWRMSCTCGYTNGACGHSYAAAKLFLEIAEHYGWDPRKPHTHAAPEPRVSPVPSAADPSPKPPAPAALPVVKPSAPTFIVEVDLAEGKLDAVLRFYLVRDGRRALMRMQQLLNLATRARSGHPSSREWDKSDNRFLTWLAPRLKRHIAVRQNLQILRLPRKSLLHWASVWGDHAGRFIERTSQKPFGAGREGSFHFELAHVDDKVEIAAVVIAPTGVRFLFHDVFRLLAEGSRELVLDGQLLDFDPPVSRELLCEVFARRSPRMPRRHVVEYLAPLIEDRLDLVYGPAVRHEEKSGRVTVTATPHGADIVVAATVDKHRFHPGSKHAAGSIREEEGMFVVTIYTASEIDAIDRLFHHIEYIREPDGSIRVHGAPRNIAHFADNWAKLPRAVRRRMAKELEGLLHGNATLTPEVAVQTEGNFAVVDVRWTCDGRTIGNREIRNAAEQNCQVFHTDDGHWLRLDTETLAKMEAKLAELGLTGETRMFLPDAKRTLTALQEGIDVEVAKQSRPDLDAILNSPTPEPVTLPARLEPILRHYQADGFSFLADRAAYRIGAVLADDMGLGKTLQVLSLLSATLRPPDAPDGSTRALVVCPSSVVSVWINEARRFCPELHCAAYRGTPEARFEVLSSGTWNVLITNYALLRQDASYLRDFAFEFVVIDEAQNIKNPEAQITRTAKSLDTKCALALTGTPLENSLLDLWSIMDFVNPGFFGNHDAFLDKYGTEARREDLIARIRPVMLRRTKDAVAPELPPVTEEVLTIDLTPDQREFYTRELVKARKVLREKGPIDLLAALMRLRQACCHPQLVTKDESTAVDSAKLDVLLDMLTEIVDEGHSALVFSQFVSMLNIIRDRLVQAGIPLQRITGSTPVADRDRRIADFNTSKEPQVFLLSLRAAGTGITLTRADYVFIYDPWWNPAVERQAIDRTHRIGQDKPVIAYRLIASETVEEKVLALQLQKAELFDAVVGGATGESIPSKLTTADLAMLLQD